MRRKPWLMRAVAVLLGLVVVALLEVVLSLLVARGMIPSLRDARIGPFVRATDSNGGDIWRTHPAWRTSFPDQSFPADLDSDAFLVFCLGGSSVYGYPFGAAVAFPHHLQEMLREANPAQDVHVVNLGGMSYGSSRLLRMVPGLTEFSPDLVIVYTGHNEFVEGDLNAAESTRRGWWTRLALVRAGSALVAGRRVTGGEGMSAFGLDVRRHEAGGVDEKEVAARCATLVQNLSLMDSELRAAGVPTIMCTVASNLADWRPESSSMSRDLSSRDVIRQAAARVAARQMQEEGKLMEAAKVLRGFLAEGGDNASHAFDLALLLRRLGETSAAQVMFRRARDGDVAPIRAPSIFAQSVREEAASRSWPLVDAETLAEGLSPDGIPGEETFIDYCHLNLEGHWRLAEALSGEAAKVLGLNTPTATVPSFGPETIAAAEQGFSKWWLGNVAIRQGRALSAIPLLAEAAELRPESSRPLVSLAQAYRAMGDRESAAEALARAVALEPDSAMALLEYGSVLSEMGRLDEAEGVLTASMSLDGDSPWLLLNLGMLELRRKRPNEALEYLEGAVQLNPNLPGAHRNIGLAHVLLGQFDAAVQAFVEALRQSPFDEPSARRLSETAARTGRAELSEAAVELASSLRNPA